VHGIRKSVLRGGVALSLRELLESICAERKYEILSLEIQPDHLHLFVSFPPSVSIADAVRVLKGAK
jgi:putative transposase